VSTGDVSRRWTLAARQAGAGFLAVVGLITVAVGLLYRFAGRSVPYLIQGQSHGGHHARRAAVCLIAGALCLAAARLLRGRRHAA
jgi:hypothetical protein